MKKPGCLAVAVLVSWLCCLSAPAARTVESLDQNWSFARFGPMPDGSHLDEPAGMQSPEFDDSSWRKLNVPHDFGIEGPFRIDLPGSTGKLPWAGIAWYRKTLDIPADIGADRFIVQFDGVMSHPKVYLNGQLAGEWAYGYNSFHVDLTPFLIPGKPNLLAVRVDNPPNSSRWYPGGGIYRHVSLTRTKDIHVAPWGVFVSTPTITDAQAEIRAQITVNSHRETASRISVETIIIAPDGRQLASISTADVEAVPQNPVNVVQTIHVPNPQRWDLQTPQLHRAITIVREGQVELDRCETTFGIREIAWKSDGFYLNGRRVQLNGVCNHHDLGPLGAAFNVRAAERQLQIMQEMGVNALRTSHNPPAPQLLDLCDRMGILVMDELFDCWRRGKSRNDYGGSFDQWHERDVRNFVRRDRNHPSVILWSSGNEIGEQDPRFHGVSRMLTAMFHQEDPTRLVGIGCDQESSGFNGFAETVDVFGFNYKPHVYKRFRERYPNQPFMGSETASTVSTRGEYFFPVDWKKDQGFFNYQVSSYDLYAPPWAWRPDIEFEGLDRNPDVAGEFVWTGFDYLGEPTPYNRDRTVLTNAQNDAERRQLQEMIDKLGGLSPSRSSYFGIVDLCGFKKDRFYIYQARWRPELPMAHILPHWDWPGREGSIIPVHVYTSGDEAELFLNGESQGRQKRGQYQYRFCWNDVRYQPGTLKVVTYKNGQPWASAEKTSTGPAATLKLHADRTRLKADGHDLSFITLSVHDSDDRLVPRARNRVKFTISGPAEVAGIDNGDPTRLESMQASECDAFNGLLLLIVRTRPGERGAIIVQASADGLPTTSVELMSE